MPQIGCFGVARSMAHESESASRLQQYASANERQNSRGDGRDEHQYEYRIAKIGRGRVKDMVVQQVRKRQRGE